MWGRYWDGAMNRYGWGFFVFDFLILYSWEFYFFPCFWLEKNKTTLNFLFCIGVWSLSWENPLEKEMAIHTSILAWRIPRTEEPRGLQSMGSQRVRQQWATNTFTFPIMPYIYIMYIPYIIRQLSPLYESVSPSSLWVFWRKDHTFFTIVLLGLWRFLILNNVYHIHMHTKTWSGSEDDETLFITFQLWGDSLFLLVFVLFLYCSKSLKSIHDHYNSVLLQIIHEYIF